jgi:hypothetical protein
MSVKVKRKDRRPELRKQLKTATGKSLERAAKLCKAIAQQLVSRKYSGPSREEKDRKNAKARQKRAEAKGSINTVAESMSSGQAET